MSSRLTYISIHLTYLFVCLTDFSKINITKSVSLLLPPHQILIFIFYSTSKKEITSFLSCTSQTPLSYVYSLFLLYHILAIKKIILALPSKYIQNLTSLHHHHYHLGHHLGHHQQLLPGLFNNSLTGLPVSTLVYCLLSTWLPEQSFNYMFDPVVVLLKTLKWLHISLRVKTKDSQWFKVSSKNQFLVPFLTSSTSLLLAHSAVKWPPCCSSNPPSMLSPQMPLMISLPGIFLLMS